MRKKFFAASICVLLLLFGIQSIEAKLTGKHREYHVSVKGSNSNDGSERHPFLTITAAAGVAMPGDVIIVHEGVYREQINPPRGGNSDTERIVYQAAKNEKVAIKGSEILKGWTKLEGDTWKVKIPNSYFGDFNPYKEIIHGDWFYSEPKDRVYHRGAVYLNGDWLMEAYKKEEVLQPADAKNPLWWTEADADSTTIWAQFKNADPNKETVEINVRPAVFYPDKPFINFITVRGFTMEHAATNWAPPTAEQPGLIGTHWSRGWIIENNVVRYSKCVGISLGKYGDEFDNKDTESAEGYVGTINRALAFGWNKSTIGSHIVRNNEVAYCEQAGIVGSLGCSFSIVQDNYIHHNYYRRLFRGAEQAGIKFHGAIDVQILHNRISNNGRYGIWLDWMTQGTQVDNNLLYDNATDIFLEVNHGPMLISNNIFLSPSCLRMNSSGAAFVHNLFAGKMDVQVYDRRLTPYMKPHSTSVVALPDNKGGAMQFINNLFVNGADASQCSKALFLPVILNGNVYTKGAVRGGKNQENQSPDTTNKDVAELLKKHKTHVAEETNLIADSTFESVPELTLEGKDVWIELALDKNWLKQSRKMVNSNSLDPAIVSQLPFENPDGTPFRIDKDFLGKKRKSSNPSPGPFEITTSGKQKIKLW